MDEPQFIAVEQRSTFCGSGKHLVQRRKGLSEGLLLGVDESRTCGQPVAVRVVGECAKRGNVIRGEECNDVKWLFSKM